MTKARELSDYTGLQGDLAAKSPLASPSFTGNVGVGTSTTYGKVTIEHAKGINNGLTLAVSDATANDNITGIQFSTNSVVSRPRAAIYSKSVTSQGVAGWGADLIFATRGAPDASTISESDERMRIDSSGRVLLGGKTGSNFAVAGTELRGVVSDFIRDSNPAINVNRLSTGGSAIAFHRSGTPVGTISVASSSTSYNTSSDYRLKTDVQPMTGATDRVKLLKPCNFEWIADGTRVDGFLAHEAQEIVPEAVSGTKDAMRDEEYEVTPAVLDDEGNETTAAVMGTRSVPDMQGIDQAKLVPLLTATIQELIARIEALEGE